MYIKFTYREIKTSEKKNFMVPLDATPCRFGGFRYWFLCPECNKRVAIIHLPLSKKIFACRECHNLTYESRRESRSALFKLVDAVCTAQELGAKLTRTTYAGLPTRKQRKVDKLWYSAGRYSPRLKSI